MSYLPFPRSIRPTLKIYKSSGSATAEAHTRGKAGATQPWPKEDAAISPSDVRAAPPLITVPTGNGVWPFPKGSLVMKIAPQSNHTKQVMVLPEQ